MDDVKIAAASMTLLDMLQIAIDEGLPIKPKQVLRRIDEIVSVGFNAIELNLDLLYWSPNAIDQQVLKALQQVHNDGIALTAHLPFVDLFTISHVETSRRASVKAILKAVKAMDCLPIEHFVLHLDGAFLQNVVETHDLPDDLREDLQDTVFSQGERTLEEILKQVPRKKLLVENLPGVPTEVTTRWARNWELKTCVDIGHVFLRNEDLVDTIDWVRHNCAGIAEFHVHDVVEKKRLGRTMLSDHKRLGSGIVDLENLARAVYRDGETPFVVLEMRFDWARHSLSTWRQIARNRVVSD